jgi:hypothetical protein
VAELKNERPASVVETLMLQLLQDAEGEDDEPLDMKSTDSRPAKGQRAAG